MDRVSRLIVAAVCSVALLALPFATSCSSITAAVTALTGQGEPFSSQEADSYYLGIDGNGFLALYKGTPGDGTAPVRTTDIAVSDLHESVVEGLEEGIVFDSFADALERIGDYRDAAKAAAKSREAEETAAEKAEEAAKAEAEKVDAASAAEPEAVSEPQSEAAPDSQPNPVGEAPAAAPSASDEAAPAGEFWGVWLNTFTDLGEAYAAADKAKSEGFASEVFEVTNWDGVTYVVGAGEFATKGEAQDVLSRAYELGYTSAYLHTAARQ